jgi:NTP pyrophosphatase (non-canonical NTP hydrolase)
VNFDIYQIAAVDTAIYPGKGTPLGLMYVALKMNGEAGEFAEHVGKAIRDDDFGPSGLTESRRQLLIKEIGDVLWYIAAAATELGIDLDTVAQQNIAKLADRKTRGVLGGSGDNR